MGTTTYSQFRENLADVWNDVEDTQEPVIIKRRGHQAMAILPADALDSLRETAYLLRSPKNARRLLEAIARAVQGEAETVDHATLSAELGLEERGRKWASDSMPNERGTESRKTRLCQRDQLFREDMRSWVGTKRKTALRVLDLMDAVLRDPFVGIGKPERLKGMPADTWSRRITDEQRLVYVVLDDRIVFVQARYHY